MATETDHKLELLARGVGTWEGVEKMPPSDRAPEAVSDILVRDSWQRVFESTYKRT